MNRADVVRERFGRSFQLYRDLAATLDGVALGSKLPGVPSNSVGAQLWCVVGARESYARAIAAGAWAGFSCSLDEPGDPASVVEALGRSERVVVEVLGGVEAHSDQQDRLMLDLLEHEAQHHGQIIRFLYALRLPIPDSWKERYALD
ncbi:MAG TPA: hypothetical protein VMP86_04585 [Candidatus Binatia bacterium]|nr:hypothetical protein [Candidatus Binatia bacterium]